MPRDRALAKQLAFGTVQRRLTLDHVIAAPRRPRRSSRPCAPRCSSGSSSCCSSTAWPPTPRSARPSSWPSRSPGHRLVNAVLRRVQREGAELPVRRRRPRARRSATRTRAWIVDLWWDWLGARRDPRAAGGRQRARRARAARQRPGRLRPRRRPRAPRGRGDRPRRARSTRSPIPATRRARSRRSRAPAQLVARALAPAAGRARARPVRGAGRQDDAPGGADGGHAARSSPSSATPSAPARCRRPRARMRAANVDGRHRRRRRLRRRRAASTASCSTRRARAWGRCARTPTCAGARAPRPIERLAAEQDALLAPRARARWPPAERSSTRSARSRRARSGSSTADVQRTFPHVDGTDGFYIARDGG